MAKVTIETPELTLSNTEHPGSNIEAWYVVRLIDQLIRALDVAYPVEARGSYRFRERLIERLQQPNAT